MGACSSSSTSNSKLAAVSSEADVYARWRRLAIISLGCLVGLLLLLAVGYYYKVHLTAIYNEELFIARRNKTQGEDIWATNTRCAQNPTYKSDMLDCEKADRYRSLDPEYTAMVAALDHLWRDDLSISNWLWNCHHGVCRSFMWSLSQQLVSNFQLVMWSCIAVSMAVLSLSGGVLYRCCTSRRKVMRVLKSLQEEPQQRALDELRKSLADTSRVAPTLVTDETVELYKRQVDEAVEQYKQAKTPHAYHLSAPVPEARLDTDQQPLPTPQRKRLNFEEVLTASSGRRIKTL